MPDTPEASFQDLIEATDNGLWESYRLATSGEMPQDGQRLIYPTYKDNVVRVSEQEAKQILISGLAQSLFWYSVETPTLGNFSFTGVNSRSAATDLTLYLAGRRRWINMEFKAKGFTGGRKKLAEITKDLKKLVLEDVNGFWFHTLKAVNNRTIANLWNVFRQELKAVVAQPGIQFSAKTITFHFCVLAQGFSVQTTVALKPGECGPTWLEEVKVNPHRVSREALESIEDIDGWSVRRKAEGSLASTAAANGEHA